MCGLILGEVYTRRHSRKLLDVSRMANIGWKAATSLREGIAKTYAVYLATLNTNNPLT